VYLTATNTQAFTGVPSEKQQHYSMPCWYVLENEMPLTHYWEMP